jgi:hypothetical protein
VVFQQPEGFGEEGAIVLAELGCEWHLFEGDLCGTETGRLLDVVKNILLVVSGSDDGDGVVDGVPKLAAALAADGGAAEWTECDVNPPRRD